MTAAGRPDAVRRLFWDRNRGGTIPRPTETEVTT